MYMHFTCASTRAHAFHPKCQMEFMDQQMSQKFLCLMSNDLKIVVRKSENCRLMSIIKGSSDR